MQATKKRSNALPRAIGALRNHRNATIIAYSALFVATLAQLAVPELVQNMINTIVEGVTAANILEANPVVRAGMLAATGQNLDEARTTFNMAEGLIVNAVVFIILFAIVRGVFSFVQTYMAELTSQGVAYDFRNAIFSKLQRLSFSYYDQQQTGQLMIRATDDVEKLRLFIAQGLLLTLQAFVLLSATLIILFATNWQLTLVILPILPLAVGIFAFFGRISQPLFREVQIRLSALNTVLQENVAGIRVVKAFVRQDYEAERFKETTDDYFEQSMRVAVIFSALFPLIFLIAQMGQALILYFAAPPILDGAIDLGEYQKFSLYLTFVFLPLGQLGFIISLMAQAAASADRIYDILDAKSEVENKPDAVTLPSVRGEVQFKNVGFRYFNSTDLVLDGVNFTAEPGQTIALLGATGSGKTTIINLIPRFYDVTQGAILIDGHDVRDVTLESLRGQIGIVLQETNLFTGTIRDNIAFGRPDATEDEIIEAAQAAAAHAFIVGFPQGYDTPVGERGATLSGGQKQRIAIARAILLKPRLLILDDATSSVDFTTERQIQNALETLMQGRTSFVIAQRISTVRNADHIIVLERGQVVGSGTHAELIEDNPTYAEIVASQLTDDTQS